jgi:two-component system sensor histidine kinase/response regulator
MDGVSATREMRKLKQLEHLPIVAMTANAMEQDRRKCMDAGMTDYLVKPIDPRDMQAILLRWIRPRSSGAAEANPRVEQAGAAGPLLDAQLPESIEGLDTKLGLSRMMGKKSLYLAMLRRYAAGQEPVAGEIRQALAAGDRPRAERLAHTTKAVSGTIGATLVQDRAAALELAIREGCGAPDLDRLLEQLETPLRALVPALDRHFSRETVKA